MMQCLPARGQAFPKTGKLFRAEVAARQVTADTPRLLELQLTVDVLGEFVFDLLAVNRTLTPLLKTA